MGKGPEQTFLPKRHTNGYMKRHGQRIYEKMLNFASYEENSSQTTVRYHLIPVRMAIINTTTSVGEAVEKKKSSYMAGENVNWGSHHGKQ